VNEVEVLVCTGFMEVQRLIGSCKGRWWFDGVGKGWPAKDGGGGKELAFSTKCQKEEKK
jgi:hypothetical protein